MCKYSKLNLNSLLRCALVHTQLTVTVMQQLSAKVLKLNFEYLHICSPLSGDFCRKKHQNFNINVLSKPIYGKHSNTVRAEI